MLHIGAHAELRNEYQGNPGSHVCTMRRVTEICKAVQVGIRSISEEEAKAAPSWLSDPAILLTAFQIARSIGFGKIIPLALAGVAAFGAAGMVGKGSGAKRETVSRETKRAA